MALYRLMRDECVRISRLVRVISRCGLLLITELCILGAIVADRRAVYDGLVRAAERRLAELALIVGLYKAGLPEMRLILILILVQEILLSALELYRLLRILIHVVSSLDYKHKSSESVSIEHRLIGLLC